MARVPRRLMKDAGLVDLTPEERHLLGCIDGSLSEDELTFVTGRGPDEIAVMLDRLVEEGLVRFGAETPSSEGGSEQPPPSGDGIELSTEERRRVDEYFGMLGTADYYALLDIPRDATKDEVKKAYYRWAPKFHPDKHYGKQLGEYKNKIEKIFATLTKAHDTLRYAKRRSSYDANLPPLKAGDRIRRRPEPPPEPPPEPRQSPAPRASNPGTAPPHGSNPSPNSGRPSYPGERPSHPGPSSQPRQSQPGVRPSRPSTPPRQTVRPRTGRRTGPVSQAEREALARKLGHRGSGPPPRKQRRVVAEVRQTQREVAEAKPRTRKSAAELLRGRYDEVRDTAKRRRLAKYLETARVAMDAGDYRAASAAFAQALRISPEDEDIQRKAQMAQELAMEQ